jgi:hypothetical protein
VRDPAGDRQPCWAERFIAVRQAATVYLAARGISAKQTSLDPNVVPEWMVPGVGVLDHGELIELAKSRGFDPEGVGRP